MAASLGLARSVNLGALALDVVDDAGVQWTVTDLAGWRGSPASTVAVTQRPAAPGGWASENPQLTPRQLVATIDIEAPDEATMDGAYEQLLTAVGTGPITLTVTEGESVRSAVVYRNGEVLPTEDGGYWGTYSVPLIAPDPRRYGAPGQVSILLPSVTGGLSWPISWPISWPATVIVGDVSLPGGAINSPISLTIYGPTTGSTPLTAPLITVTAPDGTVRTLLYTDTIGVGDYLVIDCDAKSVLYNGTSSRRGLLQVIGGWPSIPPGGGLLSFRAGSYDTTSRVLVSYRPAWS